MTAAHASKCCGWVSDEDSCGVIQSLWQNHAVNSGAVELLISSRACGWHLLHSLFFCPPLLFLPGWPAACRIWGSQAANMCCTTIMKASCLNTAAAHTSCCWALTSLCPDLSWTRVTPGSWKACWTAGLFATRMVERSCARHFILAGLGDRAEGADGCAICSWPKQEARPDAQPVARPLY